MSKLFVNMTMLTAIAVSIISCNQPESFTTESGIKVTYIQKSEESKEFNDGDIMFYNMRYSNANGYELFNTASRNAAVPIQYIEEQWKSSGLLYEALKACNVGDSATFSIPAEDLFTLTFRGRLPDTIPAESEITFIVGVEKSKTQEELQAERDAELAGKLNEDIATIDQYLTDNAISALSTESGLRYVITKEGTGERPIAGQKIVVHYHGTLLDGTVFDSSVDKGQPFSFTIGQGQVIKGWDEGLALLNTGAKATLYIPSPLAYGPRGAGAVIKPFSILKFDVELLEIQNQ